MASENKGKCKGMSLVPFYAVVLVLVVVLVYLIWWPNRNPSTVRVNNIPYLFDSNGIRTLYSPESRICLFLDKGNGEVSLFHGEVNKELNRCAWTHQKDMSLAEMYEYTEGYAVIFYEMGSLRSTIVNHSSKKMENMEYEVFMWKRQREAYYKWSLSKSNSKTD